MLINGEAGLRDVSENDRDSSDAGKACRERRGWVCKRDVFVAAVHSELLIGVLGQQHHAFVVGDRCRDGAWELQVCRSTERCRSYGALVFGVDGIDRELAISAEVEVLADLGSPSDLRPV